VHRNESLVGILPEERLVTGQGSRVAPGGFARVLFARVVRTLVELRAAARPGRNMAGARLSARFIPGAILRFPPLAPRAGRSPGRFRTRLAPRSDGGSFGRLYEYVRFGLSGTLLVPLPSGSPFPNLVEYVGGDGQNERGDRADEDNGR
jgi:hypothetical protein